ncbi:putative complex I protein [Rhypophila decipiens]|uniref:Complex I protein n=1 Tax=Rhypophila decipiens TaxID=261697 RepID=A0AAN6Y9B0_9PEZI|nr:putative complex I protein [Rhypophila decipiens]
MQATPRLLYKSFWGRSVDELKRLTNIAVNFEGVKGPQGPRELHSFHTEEGIQDCKVMSDVDIGGYSKAHLDFIQSSSSPQTAAAQTTKTTPTAYARFHGTISTQLPKNRPEIQRSGYAGWRTRDRPPTIFGRSLWDIDPYAYLAMRVKSDGRAYLVNIQTDSIVSTDLHQHRLFTTKPGEWETVLIKWNDFVRTNMGYVVEPQTEMLRQKVKSIGVSLTDRVPGPFELCIERIWATNDTSEADSVSQGPALTDETSTGGTGGKLLTKKGESVGWGKV